MQKRISLSVHEVIVEKVDEIAQQLKRNRSRTVEDLLSMVFDLGATVENRKLTYISEKEEDLKKQVELLQHMVDALIGKKEA